MYDIIIIGAGCAGLTAAIYAARAGKRVLVLEAQAVGGQIARSPRVENYPGIAVTTGLAFADALYEQANALGVELDFCRVQSVRPGAPFTVVTEDGEHTAKAVIIAAGASARPLGVQNEEKLAGKGVSYCAICDGAFFKGQSVAVVGGGSAALQSAQFLAGLCQEVTLIHRRDAFRGEETLAARLRTLPNVKLALGRTVQSLVGENELTSLVLKNVVTGEEETLPVQGLFVAVGQKPANLPFEDLCRMDGAGYILASEDCATSRPGVFAAGDCRAKPVRQLTTAAADGAVAALAACAWADEHP